MADGMASISTDIALFSFGLTLVGHLVFLAIWRSGTEADGTATRQPVALLVRLALAATAGWAAVVMFVPSNRIGSVAVHALDLVRYAAWLGFLLLGLSPRDEPVSRVSRNLRAVVVLLLASSALLGAWVTLGPAPAAAGRAWLAANLGLSMCGLLVLEQLFRNGAVDTRWQVKPVFLGLAGIFGYDTYLFSEALLFGELDVDAYAIRGAVHTLALPFFWLAWRRHRDWHSRIQVSRTAAFFSATLVFVGTYLLLMAAVGYYIRYFGGDWGRALQIGMAVAAFLFLGLLVLSSAARSRMRVFVGKHFFRYRYDYRQEWLQFTALLSTRTTPQALSEAIVMGMARLVECPAGGLWTKTADGTRFAQIAHWNMTPAPSDEPANSALCNFMRSAGWVVDLDEYRSSPRRYGELALPTWLLGIRQGWLVVPLMAGDELQGFVVLARPLTPIKLNWEVLDLLKTVGRQAAAYLAQMQAAEALLEARKFDAFNRMSAFVVHDLKNIVAQLSLMLKNAQRLADNPEFRQDMLLTVESSLEKMRRLMLQLREGATPPGGSRGVELQPIVLRLCALARSQGRELHADTVEPVATRGHDERLERVLGHFVQNALDATPPDGRVWIEARRVVGQIKVEVGDTGVGMTEEFIRTRLFKPFSSTKANGMGIGSYESHQYIRELGGEVHVHSTPGAGTRIEVTLPVFEAARGSDLLAQDAVNR